MLLINDKKIIFQEGHYKTIKDVPMGTWILSQTMDGFELNRTTDFKHLPKYYGKMILKADKVLNTFNNINKNLGVLATGLKGTGKTQLARKIAIDSKLPVIVIASQFTGVGFIELLSSFPECVVMFDEFDKVYPEQKDQNVLLSVLDGFESRKKIFIFTSNTTSRYNNYLQNRPSRVRYNFNFSIIEKEMVEEMAQDLLDNKEYIKDIVKYSSLINECSTDTIKELIKECNIYKLSPKEAIEDMNIEIGVSSGFFKFNIKGELIKYPSIKIEALDYDGNPLSVVDDWFTLTQETQDKYPLLIKEIEEKHGDDTRDEFDVEESNDLINQTYPELKDFVKTYIDKFDSDLDIGFRLTPENSSLSINEANDYHFISQKEGVELVVSKEVKNKNVTYAF